MTSSPAGEDGDRRVMMEEGSKVTFRCGAQAVDTADILWLTYEEDPRVDANQ